MSDSEAPAVLHVYLDEVGGGPAHVALLREVLGDAIQCEAVRLNPRGLGPSPLGWVAAYRQIIQRMGSDRIIVHAHGVRAGAAALFPARRCGTPLVITVHGLHSVRRSRGPTEFAALALNRAVLRSASRVLVLSEADRRLIHEKGLASPARVHRIPAAFPSRPGMHRLAARRVLGLPQGADIVLWLGRLALQKDPLMFLRGLERLEMDDLIGLVVGDGPLLPQIRTSVEAERLGERLRFAGWMQEPAPALAAADVFVSTSRWEGLSIAALEAAAAGLPLVLSDCPGNRDVVEAGIPAVLVAPGDAPALSSELGRLLHDANLRGRLGRESRAAVNRAFSVDRFREEMVATYREVLEEMIPPIPGRVAAFAP